MEKTGTQKFNIKQVDRQSDRQTYRKTNRQNTYRQTDDRQTETQADRRQRGNISLMHFVYAWNKCAECIRYGTSTVPYCILVYPIDITPSTTSDYLMSTAASRFEGHTVSIWFYNFNTIIIF